MSSHLYDIFINWQSMSFIRITYNYRE